MEDDMNDRSNESDFRLLLVATRGTEVDLLARRDLTATASQRSRRPAWVTWECPHGMSPDSAFEPNTLLAMDAVAVSEVSAHVDVLLRDPGPSPSLHVSQPWNPVRCVCGVVHGPCDPMAIVIAVGPHARGEHFDPDAFVIRIAPEATGRDRGSHMIVRPTAEQDFGPWARDAVEAIAISFIEPGLVGFDLIDVNRVSSAHPEWTCHHISTTTDAITEDIVACGLGSHATRAAWVAFAGGTNMRLSTLSDAIAAFKTRVADESTVIYSASVVSGMDANQVVATVFTAK